MAKPKDRPAAPEKTVKSAAAKSPASPSATQARKPGKTAPDSAGMDAISPTTGDGGAKRPGSGTMGAQPTPEQVYRMIQETAYFKAKARDFAPGHEVQDWIEAEAEVRTRLEDRA
jgi:hypothetical protein